MYNLYSIFDNTDELNQFDTGGENMYQELQLCPPGYKDDGNGKCIPVKQEPEINLYTPNVKIEYGSKSPGANMVDESDKPLLDINNTWLSKRQEQISNYDLNYVTTLFTALNTLPVIDGNEVPISQFSTIMTDANKRKKLLEQASKLEDSPELDEDTRWSLVENHLKTTMLSGLVLQGQKIIDEDLYQAAVVRQSKKKDNNLFEFQTLFDKNKQLIPQSQWELNQVNYLIEQFNKKADQENAKGVSLDPNSISQLYLREKRQQERNGQQPITAINLPGSKFNYNKYNQEQYNKNLNSLLNQPLSKYKPVNNKNYKSSPFYSQVKGLYSDYLNGVYDQYNLTKDPGFSARKLSADLENKFDNNKGGAKHSPVIEQTFDFSSPYVIADQINDDENTGGLTLKKNQKIPNEAVSDVANLLRIANVYNNEIVIGLGGVQAKIPEESWEKGSEAVKAIINELQKKHSKTSNLIPKGSIKFQGIVGGDNKYHAYTLKMPIFFSHSQFKGQDGLAKDEDNKPNKELLNNGITFYVPVKYSEESITLAKKFTQGTKISAVEGLLNWKNDIDLTIPEGGKIKLVKDPKNGVVSINTYGVLYNPDTKRISDTLRVTKNNTFTYDPSIDLDAIVNKQINLLKDSWFFNQKAKKQFSVPNSDSPKED